MSQKLKIGFVGVGAMGQAAHLRNYTNLEDCEVVAIAEIKQQMAHKVAARHGVPKVYASHGDMLAHEKLDGIVASQPFTRHGTLVPELAAAGIPIFTEKPIAGSIAMGEKIIAALKANKTWLMVGYHKRSDPATELAKAEIVRLQQSGELGRMRYLRLVMPPGDWVAGGFRDNLAADDPAPALEWDPAPGEIPAAHHEEYWQFVNYYIHQVNLLRHLLGEAYTVSYADPSRVLFVGHSTSGITCTIEMAPYNTTLEWQESALACFEKGYVKLELPAPLAYNRPGRLEIFHDPGKGATPSLQVPTLPWVHAMRNQASNFLKAIRGEKPAPCLAPEALEDLKIARDYIHQLKGL